MNKNNDTIGSSQDNQDNMTEDLDKETEKVSSSAPDRRKTSKPIMEKRRRARINASLTELKTFLLDVIKKEGLRHNKMEKADILELTVRHLRQLQRQQYTVSTSDEGSTSDTFRLGFSECTSEVTKFLSRISNIEPNFQVKLLEHLSMCSSSEDSLKSPNVSISPVRSSSSMKSDITREHHNFEKCATSSMAFENTADILYNSHHTDDNSVKPGNASSTQMCNMSSQQLTMLHADQLTQHPSRVSSTDMHNLSFPQSKMSDTNRPIQQSVGISTIANDASVQAFQQLKTCATPIGNASGNVAFGNIISGIQLVPVQLPSGETFYFIPTNILTNNCVPIGKPSVPITNFLSQNTSQPTASSAYPCVQSSPRTVIETIRIPSRSPMETYTKNNQNERTLNFDRTIGNNIEQNEPNVTRNEHQISLQQHGTLEPVWRPW
ncbi:hairy/enhancer-of-split related with YRPW motif protein 2-like [Mytilus trossulus]|uniref:hairy/enhancer-of-split related with YRPW motif protein 2-like n=1 Tax=Mytilus trossulus TaxID=6551 RepID=UPI00300666A0